MGEKVQIFNNLDPPPDIPPSTLPKHQIYQDPTDFEAIEIGSSQNNVGTFLNVIKTPSYASNQGLDPHQ